MHSPRRSMPSSNTCTTAPPNSWRTRLRAVAGAPTGTLAVLDAGCGTGLCGRLLKPWARLLAGCDLSEGMLRLAHARRIYDTLHQAELVHYLDTQPPAFDVVVAADTLCYFGELGDAMAAASRALRPGGWLIFTVEALDGDSQPGHQLRPTGRYAHSADYVRSRGRCGRTRAARDAGGDAAPRGRSARCGLAGHGSQALSAALRDPASRCMRAAREAVAFVPGSPRLGRARGPCDP